MHQDIYKFKSVTGNLYVQKKNMAQSWFSAQNNMVVL